MATPLDLRNRRREAQRAVRLAVNAVNAALDAWAVAVSDGKRAATALTNAALTQVHLPALPLGPLADVPGLRQAAAAKLQGQQDAALAELAGCLERLQAAVAGLADVVASLAAIQQREAAAPLLGEGAVFATLPLRLLCGMLRDVHEQHAAELAVKAGVVHAFTKIVGDRRASTEAIRASSKNGGMSTTGRAAATREEALRRSLQVLVTAWMLSAEVDDGKVQAHLAAITAEMRGF